MDESKIARINELYHKSKEVGLSDASGSHRRLKSVVRHANWMYSGKQQIFIVI